MLQTFDYVAENAALPTYNLDPDLNFYNDYTPNQNLTCKYFAEESFNSTYDKMFLKNYSNPHFLSYQHTECPKKS